MARKKKAGRRRQDDSDSDTQIDSNLPAQLDSNVAKNSGLSRKQLRQQKIEAKKARNGGTSKIVGKVKDHHDDNLDDDIHDIPKNREIYGSNSDENIIEPKKKLTKKQLKRQREREAAEKRAITSEHSGMEDDHHEKLSSDHSMNDYIHAIPIKIETYGSDSDEKMNNPKKKLTKKQLKRQKEREAAEKRATTEHSRLENEGERESDEEDLESPFKVKNDKVKKTSGFAAFTNTDSEENESESEEVPQPVKKKGKNKKKDKAKKVFTVDNSFSLNDELSNEKKENKNKKVTTYDSNDDGQKEEEADNELDVEERLVEEVNSINLRQNEDSDGNAKEKKKKKKKKKNDKEKEKKEKKKSKQEIIADGNVDEPLNEAEEKAKKKAERKERKALKAEKLAKELSINERKEKENSNVDNEVMYGAPDDVAWTDKSAAILESEKKQNASPDLTLIYGKNGKKLSNKERKRLLKERQAAERQAEYEKEAAKASAEGAQFACSQTAVNEDDPQWQHSLDINIPSFSISAAGKILFEDATFNIGHGKRYGLIGPNGKGKSTLLKMVASNDLKLPPRVDYLYVEQEVVADGTPAVDAVLKADKKRWELIEEERMLTQVIENGDEDPKKLARLQNVYEELSSMGADSAESKARRILYGLGFDVGMQTKPTKMFSGGWRMRISLARALFIEPTLLMLDEPTNHLDLNAVIWLEDYLQRWKKTLLVVSHDQDFLNSVCSEMLHIEDLKLVSYKGDFDSFKKEQVIRLKQQLKAWEKQEKKLRGLKRSGQSRTKAVETVKKNTKREPGARSQKKKNDAIASGTAAAEVTELIKRPREYSVKLHFAEVAELSRPVMQVSNVKFRYSEKHPIIFESIDFGIDMDSRICVVGPNGAGKSTLLKLLTGEVIATKGDVRRNPRLRMGIYNQHFVDRLPMDKTPIDYLRNCFQDEDYQSIRNRLGKYGLEGHAHEVVMRDLSGGQKARVVFVELSLQRPHILLLDEPTNNLDIETIDALIQAINEFNGGIVVVTHDQRLIEHCECSLWVVEKQAVTNWDSGFDSYKSSLLQEMDEKIEIENHKRQEQLQKLRDEKIARIASKFKK